MPKTRFNPQSILVVHHVDAFRYWEVVTPYVVAMGDFVEVKPQPIEKKRFRNEPLRHRPPQVPDAENRYYVHPVSGATHKLTHEARFDDLASALEKDGFDQVRHEKYIIAKMRKQKGKPNG